MESLGREANPSAEVLESLSPLIKRQDLICAALLASTTSALGPAFSFAQAVLSGLTPAHVAQTDQRSLQILNWKAAFLNEDQNETFLSLYVIIPATETPGTKKRKSIAILTC